MHSWLIFSAFRLAGANLPTARLVARHAQPFVHSWLIFSAFRLVGANLFACRLVARHAHPFVHSWLIFPAFRLVGANLSTARLVASHAHPFVHSWLIFSAFRLVGANLPTARLVVHTNVGAGCPKPPPKKTIFSTQTPTHTPKKEIRCCTQIEGPRPAIQKNGEWVGNAPEA